MYSIMQLSKLMLNKQTRYKVAGSDEGGVDIIHSTVIETQQHCANNLIK